MLLLCFRHNLLYTAGIPARSRYYCEFLKSNHEQLPFPPSLRDKLFIDILFFSAFKANPCPLSKRRLTLSPDSHHAKRRRTYLLGREDVFDHFEVCFRQKKKTVCFRRK